MAKIRKIDYIEQTKEWLLQMNWYDIRSVYRIVNSLYQKEQDLKKIK